MEGSIFALGGLDSEFTDTACEEGLNLGRYWSHFKVNFRVGRLLSN